jgi:hypothetical protein
MSASSGLPPALLDHLRESHTDVTELGPLAELAEVDTLVLTHLVPADPLPVSDRQWRRNAGHGYSGGFSWATTCSTWVYAGRRRVPSAECRPWIATTASATSEATPLSRVRLEVEREIELEAYEGGVDRDSGLVPGGALARRR